MDRCRQGSPWCFANRVPRAPNWKTLHIRGFRTPRRTKPLISSPSRPFASTPPLHAQPQIKGDVNSFGVMMVALGDADGMVSGAIHTTAATIRPAMQVRRLLT